MKSLLEIKITLDKLYGFDIMKKTRKSRYAYAKKVFINLASNYGYRGYSLTDEFNITSDAVDYAQKTFHLVGEWDVFNYNECVSLLGLGLKEIPSVRSLQENTIAEGIFEELKKLSRKDLLSFKNGIFANFIKEANEFKSIQESLEIKKKGLST